MSTRIIEEILDDLDGTSDNVETIQFAYRGVPYEIDLGPENLAELDRLMATYTEAARRVEVKHPKRSPKPSGSADSDATAIRIWARSQGIPIGDRGRVSASIRAAYYAGHASR